MIVVVYLFNLLVWIGLFVYFVERYLR